MRFSLQSTRSHAALAGASILVGAYDQAAIGVALGPLRARWHLASSEVALIASASAAGMVVGGLVAGLLADRLGRRRLLVVDVALLALASLAAAFAPGAGVLLAARLVGGIAVGASYTIVFVYQRELTSTATSTRWMATTLWAANWGMLLAYGVGAIAGGTTLGARIVLGVGALGALPLVAARRRLPETQTTDGHLSLRESLAALRSVRELEAAGAWFLYQISDQGINVLLPIVVAGLGVASLRSADATALVVKAVTIPASLTTIWLVGWLGRRRLQLAGFLGRALALGLVAVAFALGAPLVVTVTLLAVGLAAGSMGPDKTTVMGACLEDDSMALATRQGVAQTAGRLGGIVGPAAFVLLTSVGGPALGIALFALSALAGWAITLPMTA